MVDESRLGKQVVDLSVYAKHRGVSKAAVSKAVSRGRLKASIVMVNGRPKVANISLADQEWVKNSSRPGPGRTSSEPDGTQGLPPKIDLDCLAACRLSGMVVIVQSPPGTADDDLDAARKFFCLSPADALALAAGLFRAAHQPHDD